MRLLKSEKVKIKKTKNHSNARFVTRPSINQVTRVIIDRFTKKEKDSNATFVAKPSAIRIT